MLVVFYHFYYKEINNVTHQFSVVRVCQIEVASNILSVR